MSQPDNKQKVPLGAKIGLGLLNVVFGAASKLSQNRKGEKTGAVYTFGSGGLKISRDTYTDARTFTFRIMSAAAAGTRGTAVSGTVALGEVHVGDTVTCVTADGRQFPCVVGEIERLFANPPGTDVARAGAGAQEPPFYVLYVAGHGAEEFHAHDKFIREEGGA